MSWFKRKKDPYGYNKMIKCQKCGKKIKKGAVQRFKLYDVDKLLCRDCWVEESEKVSEERKHNDFIQKTFEETHKRKSEEARKKRKKEELAKKKFNIYQTPGVDEADYKD